MALIHRATIRPTKAELLADWVPTQPWGEPESALVGAYRFDDPDGEVGIEAHVLATADGHWLHAPLTYRGAPLDGAEQFLVCTMEHSVLGRRWIYDAVGDPVYALVLASVLLAGAVQAAELVEGADAPREPSVRVTGSRSGADDVPPIDAVRVSSDRTSTVMEVSDELRMVVCRRPGPEATATDREHVLTGTWSGLEAPVLLAYVA
ncbi:CG0192-related protein [Cellulomonas sp. ICMP 17802]|uniref:CG0192-related protein n=1 Tax=Cellulomonas sp. ICMP 17802 TaxID=3239199 RepID=UPI00351AFD2B